MKKTMMLPLVLMALMSVTVGCNKKSDDGVSIGSRTARTNSIPNQYNAQGYYYTAATGRISGNYDFESATKTFLSPTISPESIGSIDSNSVFLRGYVEVDYSGNVIANRSSISIEIRDSYAGGNDNGQTVPAIHVNMQAASGRAYGGQVDLSFRDNYATVRMVGTFSNVSGGNQFTGQITFQNNGAYQQTWGNFQIDTCGFFRCQ
ncbi:MAG: hypothetical protein KF681_18220 [Bdellovibrionaceae bacterium]|nr:hypothetical protein [Pseudobdellovibrionaceae bacterium]